MKKVIDQPIKKIAESIFDGILGFNPIVFEKEVTEAQYLIDGFAIGLSRWCLDNEKESPGFNDIPDAELLKMYSDYCSESLKKRMRK